LELLDSGPQWLIMEDMGCAVCWFLVVLTELKIHGNRRRYKVTSRLVY